jgi:pimeloyl-ACP methyl ester carboxylesterase
MNIAYDDRGTGDALVLVHGHPFDRSMWHPQVFDGWRVIAPDLRGYGESPVVPGVTPLSTFAADIEALLDRLDVARFVLGGLSMGGQIALECYRLFGSRIRGLILADTFAQAETPAGRAHRNRMADRLLSEGMAGYTAEALPKMVSPQHIEATEYVSRMMLAARPTGAAAALRGRAERPDYTGMLPTISVPTLVIVGSDDEFTPIADAEYMHVRIPGSTLVVVEGAAHMPNLERPAEFNKAVADLLAAVRS